MEKTIYNFTIGSCGYDDEVYIREDENQFIVDFEIDTLRLEEGMDDFEIDTLRLEEGMDEAEIPSLYIPKERVDKDGNHYMLNATDAFLKAMDYYWYEKLQKEGKCE